MIVTRGQTMKKVKNLNKTKTIIAANLYDSQNYKVEFTHSKFIDAALQLAQEFPETFKILDSSFVHVTIQTIDLKHCFELYKYNEEKVITKVKG
jgi:hypothetical protein